MSMESHGGMISTGETPELSGNSTSSHLVESQEEHGEGNDGFDLRSMCFQLRSDFLHGVKSYDMEPKEGVLRTFIALKNPSSSAGF
jgi:hypothetical protein